MRPSRPRVRLSASGRRANDFPGRGDRRGKETRAEAARQRRPSRRDIAGGL